MKNIIRTITVFLIVSILFSSESFAQLFPTLGGQRVGISTAQFLKIGVGSRATSLGDAFVAIADDASALYWNPAGLVQFTDNQVIVSHNTWVVDISHDFLGLVYHVSPMDAVGLSITSLSMQKMPVTTEFAPTGTGEYFSFGDIAFSLSYARAMTDKFSFGGTVRYMEETLDKLKMRGVMIDLGTYYWTGLGTSRFAVVITNFGNQMAPDGEVILFGNRKKSEWQAFSPPTMFRFGFAFEPIYTDKHKLTTSVQLNHPNDNSENISFGAEYMYDEPLLYSKFFLRGGYKFNADEQDFSLGAGLALPLPFANIKLDYGYANFSRLGSAHRFTLILGAAL